MSDKTKIEWTDATVNAVNGCSVVSPGCTNCYAMKLAGTRLRNHPSRAGLTIDTKAGPVWNGEVRLNESAIEQPLRWKRPRDIFWNAHGDLFHPKVPDAWVDRIMVVCAATPQHRHQILTKRPERMRAYFADRTSGDPWAEAADWVAGETGLNVHPAVPEPSDFPLPNVWLGTSVEDQARADERIPHLLATPAAVRFLSCEPLLGPVDLTNITGAEKSREYGSPVHGWSAIWRDNNIGRAWIDWVIVGGESGPGARPMHPDWVRSLRDQCAATGTAFFFKQWGAFVTEDQSPEDIILPGEIIYRWGDGQPGVFKVGKSAAGRLLDGVEHSGMPR